MMTILFISLLLAVIVGVVSMVGTAFGDGEPAVAFVVTFIGTFTACWLLYFAWQGVAPHIAIVLK